MFSLLVSTAYPKDVFADDYPGYVSIGGKIGSERNIGETQAFLPITQGEDDLLFGDVRFKQDTLDAWEGNAGLGYRKVINNDFILGGYGFFDYRSTDNDNKIRQLSFGAEILTENYDARINTYFPERDKKLVSSNTQIVQTGSQLFYQNSNTYEKGAPGADIEIGRKLPIENADIRLYLGGYQFFLDDSDDMQGVSARARWQTASYDIGRQPINFRISSEFRYDNIREHTNLFGAELVLPFGGSKKQEGLSPLRSRMVEPIVRDIDIISSSGAAQVSKEAAQTTIAGQNFSEVHVVQANDTATLMSGIADIPENSAIILETSSPILLTSPITLKKAQALVSSDINVHNNGFANVNQFTTGSRAQLIKGNAIANGSALINLDADSENKLSNIDLLTESGNKGDAIIMISNNGNAIKSLVLNNVRSDGAVVVDIDSGSTDVSIKNGEYHGLDLRARSNSNMNVDIENSTFYRSYTVAQSFPQNITSIVLIESMDASTLTVNNFANNTLIDDKAKVGGRAAVGMGFVSRSSNAMQVNNFINNSITRTTGGWDAGAILGQGAYGGLVKFDGFYGNTADVFETIGIRLNIGKAGFSANAAGVEAANPTMDFFDYGNVQITNTY